MKGRVKPIGLSRTRLDSPLRLRETRVDLQLLAGALI